MVQQLHQRVKNFQKQRLQIPINGNRMLLQHLKVILQPVGRLLNTPQPQHRRPPLHRVGRPEHLIDHLRIVDGGLQVQKPLFKGIEVVPSLLNEIPHNALLLILHGESPL